MSQLMHNYKKFSEPIIDYVKIPIL